MRTQRSIAPESEHQVEQVVGTLLQFGVLFATGIVFVGGMLYLTRHGLEAPNYHVFRGEPDFFRTPSGVATSIITGRYRGLIQLGLLLLIATPIARVVLALFVFLRQRDWTYMLVTFIVFTGLVVSLFAG